MVRGGKPRSGLLVNSSCIRWSYGAKGSTRPFSRRRGIAGSLWIIERLIGARGFVSSPLWICARGYIVSKWCLAGVTRIGLTHHLSAWHMALRLVTGQHLGTATLRHAACMGRRTWRSFGFLKGAPRYRFHLMRGRCRTPTQRGTSVLEG